MKIEIKEREKNSYYDELLYITSNYKKIFDNPKKKVHPLSLEAIALGLLSISVLIMFIILYKNNSDRVFLFGQYIFTLLTVLSVIYYFLIRKRISSLKNVKGIITISLEEEFVKFLSKKTRYKVGWKDIKYVLINKKSICFIPKKSGMILISLSTKYKDKVINRVNELDKSKLIIDNCK